MWVCEFVKYCFTGLLVSECPGASFTFHMYSAHFLNNHVTVKIDWLRTAQFLVNSVQFNAASKIQRSFQFAVAANGFLLVLRSKMAITV